jgi:hypothetical protein
MDLPKELWPTWGDHKKNAHTYALCCMAHRFRKFGFESSVNMLDPRSMIYFSMCVHEPMASACIKHAIACGPSLKRIIYPTHEHALLP